MEKTDLINKEVRISNIPGVLYNVVGIITKIKGNTVYIGSGMKVEIDEETIIKETDNGE